MEELPRTSGLWVEQTLTKILEVLSYIPGSKIIGRYIKRSHQNDPMRTVFEVILFGFTVAYFLASKRPYDQRTHVNFTEEEIDELVKEWRPDPLVDPLTEEQKKLLDLAPVIVGENGPKVHIKGSDGEFMNFTSTDLHNFAHYDSLKKAAVETIRYAGVGSCGPAGFYGNEDFHNNAEADISKWLGTESSMLYAQDNATAPSVLPCFAKRGDVLVIDQAVNISLQIGARLSRAKIFWFRHNEMEDLERQLKYACSLHKKGALPRRFIITQGLFDYTANSPDLKKVVELKNKYKFRLILDESWSLGVLGQHGRGLPEEQGVPRSDIDITIGSLSAAMGSSGGFCSGAKLIIDHQRITSLAYTFSATCPPYLARVASEVVKMLEDDKVGPPMVAALREKASVVYKTLQRQKHIQLISRPDSPLVVFCLSDSLAEKLDTEAAVEQVLDAIVLESRKSGVLISRLQQIQEFEKYTPINAIRLYVPNGLSESEVKNAASLISKAITKAVKQ